VNILKSLDTLEKIEALIEKAERAYLGRSGFGDLSYRLQDLMEGIDDMLKENRVESKRRIRDLEDEVALIHALRKGDVKHALLLFIALTGEKEGTDKE